MAVPSLQGSAVSPFVPFSGGINQPGVSASRGQYNTALSSLNSAFQSHAQAPTYEQELANLTGTYGKQGISPQEIQGTLYNMYSKYGPAPTVAGGSTNTAITAPAGYGSGGTSATSTSGLTPQQVADQLAIYGHNYDQAVQDANTQMGQLQGQHDQQANTYNTYYTGQQSALDTAKQQQDQSLASYLGTHGIGDSTWGQTQQANANKSYQDQVMNLHNDQIGKLQALDQALADSQSKLNLQKQNLDLSQFSSLDQLQSAANQINDFNTQLSQQREAIKNAVMNSQSAIQKLSQSPQYTSAKATQDMTDQINKMIAAGTSKQQIRGYIQQGANKNELNSLLDYYQNVSAAPGAPATLATPQTI